MSSGDVCSACPFCAGLSALRDASPEALAHLTVAIAELAAAARAILAAVEAGAAAATPRASTIERIRLA